MLELIKAIASVMMMLVTGSNAPLPQQPTVSQTADNLPKKGEMWVDSVYNSLNTRDRVAQLVVSHLVVSDNEAGRAAVKKSVGVDKVGGILLAKGTVDSYASLISLAQKEAQVPLMVTLDGEWGLAMRLTDAPRFPYNMALGAITDTQLLYDYGQEMARECRALGIQVNFAPVEDVNSNPLNPVIGYRSFGEDPRRVGKLGMAVATGMEDGGVMSCAKHFPGHGDTSSDSHKTLPTVSHTRSEMEKVDFKPFEDYIEAGLSSVMVGHLNVPSLDPSGTPSSLSRPIVTGILKDKLGFKGMIFTDALEMQGARVGTTNNCVEALKAGADVLLCPINPSADISAVVKAIESGELDEASVMARVKKMLRYKYALGLSRKPVINRATVGREINSPAAEIINQRLANAAITVLSNKEKLIPVPQLESNTVGVVTIGASASNQFSNLCRKYVACETTGVDKGAVVTAAQLSAIAKNDITIVAVTRFDKQAVESFNKIRNSARKLIAVFLINPYKMSQFGNLNTLDELVVAYDDTPALRRAAAMALFGGIEVSGRMPVNVTGVAKVGQGETIAKSRLGYALPQEAGFSGNLTAAVDSVINNALKEKAMPGCQVLVAKGGDVVLDKCYGNISFDSSTPVTPETIYDLASMTKVTATVSGLMRAYDEDLFDLNAHASKYITGLKNTDKEKIKVKQLLYHESGLPATLNLYKVMFDTASYSGPITKAIASAAYPYRINAKLYGNRDAKLRGDLISSKPSDDRPLQIAEGIYASENVFDTIMSRIYRANLRKTNNYHYSDLNFALLMELEQNVTGVAHDQWVETEIFGPLGANVTGYNPRSYYPAEKIAPTENDRFMRKQTLRGYVHDELAAFSGGVQGNAGLFSNTTDLAKLFQMWLNGGKYGDAEILDSETIKLFTLTKSPTANRTLGFDMPANYKSMADVGAGKKTYGHTGFTGTCFWIDPDKELIYIFLSNRVNPTRENSAFSKVNPRVGVLSAIYRNLIAD